LIASQNKALACENIGALEGIRTPNLLIRSQMLYPLSYERRLKQYMAVDVLTVRVDGAGMITAVIERRSLILNELKVLVISVFALHAPTTSGASRSPASSTTRCFSRCRPSSHMTGQALVIDGGSIAI
jgi:hypothetical protein